MARKIFATAPDGTIFERRTDRVYTHAVVSQIGPTCLRRLEDSAKEWTARDAAGAERTDYLGWSLEEIHHTAVRTAEQLERVRALVAAGTYDYATWHHRADLAAKEAAKRNTDPYYANAIIVAVEDR